MSKYAGRRIGRDRIERLGDRLAIITPSSHMPGWDVRKYRAPVIRFEGLDWRITDRIPLPDKSTRFELIRWNPNAGEIPGPQIEYTPEFVAVRDHALAIGRRRSRGTMWLNYIGPFTGFLPAATKSHLEAVYGIDCVTSTKWSIFMEFLAALAGFVLASIGTMVIAYGFPSPIVPMTLIGIGVVSGVDAGVRLGRVLSEERPPPGFYEWLFHRRRR